MKKIIIIRCFQTVHVKLLATIKKRSYYSLIQAVGVAKTMAFLVTDNYKYHRNKCYCFIIHIYIILNIHFTVFF